MRCFGIGTVVPGLIMIGLLGCAREESGEVNEGASLAHMRDSGDFAALPVNPLPLERGYRSAEELVDSLLDALEQLDSARLVDLAVSPDEWRKIIYPELGLHYPDARDDRAEIMEMLGELHFGSSLKGLHRMLRDFGGESIERTHLELGPPLKFPSFTMHEKTKLTLSTPDAEDLPVTFLGSIVEKDGVFKLLSYRESDQRESSGEE